MKSITIKSIITSGTTSKVIVTNSHREFRFGRDRSECFRANNGLVLASVGEPEVAYAYNPVRVFLCGRYQHRDDLPLEFNTIELLTQFLAAVEEYNNWGKAQKENPEVTVRLEAALAGLGCQTEAMRDHLISTGRYPGSDARPASVNLDSRVLAAITDLFAIGTDKASGASGACAEKKELSIQLQTRAADPHNAIVTVLSQSHRHLAFGPVSDAHGSKFIASNNVILASRSIPDFGTYEGVILCVQGENQTEDKREVRLPVKHVAGVLQAVAEYNKAHSSSTPVTVADAVRNVYAKHRCPSGYLAGAIKFAETLVDLGILPWAKK